MFGKTRQRFAPLIMVLVTSAIPAGPACARFFNMSGSVTACNPLACAQLSISVGDPVSGFIEVEDAASGPNSTFTDADVTSFELAIGGLFADPGSGSLGAAVLSTDASGSIFAGTLDLATTADFGALGTGDLNFAVDAGAGTFELSTTFLALGAVSSGPIEFTVDSLFANGFE